MCCILIGPMAGCAAPEVAAGVHGMASGAFPFLGKVEPEKFLEILTGTLFVAPFQKVYGQIIASETYEPAGFAAALGLKDMRLVLAAADASGVPMPMASVVHDRFQAAVGRGHREKDWSVIARLAAEDSGL